MWALFDAFFASPQGQAWRDQVWAEMRDSGMDEEEFIETRIIKPMLDQIRKDLGRG